MNLKNSIQLFRNSSAFGVVGASNDRSKFGNKVLRHYLNLGLKVFPIHPREETVEELVCLRSLSELPSEVESLSVITPPTVTEKVVEEAIQKGIKNIWMQPGAESPKAIELCKKAGINLIAGGPCVLVDFK